MKGAWGCFTRKVAKFMVHVLKKVLTFVDSDDIIVKLSRASGRQTGQSAKRKSKKFLTNGNDFDIIYKLLSEIDENSRIQQKNKKVLDRCEMLWYNAKAASQKCRNEAKEP